MASAQGLKNQPKTERRVGDGTPGPGRPKGCANKTTVLAKAAIAEAADKLGGTDRLVAWAQEDPQNERVFWGTIYPKLLPLQVTGEGGGAVIHEIRRVIFDPASAK